jgi:hypothetical protein
VVFFVGLGNHHHILLREVTSGENEHAAGSP